MLLARWLSPRLGLGMRQMTEVLYSDSLICITKNLVRFQQYYFPFGSKSIEISQIDHVEILIPTLLSGKWRIHGSGDFRTWFPRDAKRPRRDLIFIIHLRSKWRRIGFTAEDSDAVIEIFKDKNIIIKDRTPNKSLESDA
jgi:hypothetical protein